MKSFINSYLEIFLPLKKGKPDGDVSGDLDFLRNLLFFRILAVILPAGLIVLIPSVVLSFEEEFYLLGAMDIVAFALVAVSCFAKSLALKYRKLLLSSTLYVLGILLILEIGINGPGFIYLLGVSVIVTSILSSKLGYLSIILNAVLIFSYISVVHANTSISDADLPANGNIIISLNFLLVNTFSVYSISLLIRGLDKSLSDSNRLRLKAEESNKLKSAFLMNISHEIHTPLNSILGFTGIIEENLKDPGHARYIRIIEESSNRLIRSVSNIVDASLIQQNQLKLSKVDFDLHDALQEAYESRKLHHRQSKDHIEFIFENELEGSSLPLYNDKDRLVSVLEELLDNAYKFTDEGVIELACDQQNHHLIITIEDDGQGMSMTSLNSLNEFFHQGDDPLTCGFDGLGLGLPIVHSIIKLMGYEIEFASKLGIGTTVKIRIPRADLRNT